MSKHLKKADSLV